MKLRPSPALVIALLALVVSMAGTSYAAVQITSGDIKNNTIKSKDIKDGQVNSNDVADGSLAGADLADGSVRGADVGDGSLTGADVGDGSLTGADVGDGSLTGADVGDGSLTGADVADGSLTSADLAARTCASSTVQVGFACIDKTATGPGLFSAALADCESRHGRLMSWDEFTVLAGKPGVTWADGVATHSEFLDEVGNDGQRFVPAAINLNGYHNVIDADSQSYWHRCVTMP